jgi:hypothetical protein
MKYNDASTPPKNAIDAGKALINVGLNPTKYD